MSFRSAVAFLSVWDSVHCWALDRGYEAVGRPTHILGFDFGLAFSQTSLNELLFASFVISETLNKVVKGFFEPECRVSIDQTRTR